MIAELNQTIDTLLEKLNIENRKYAISAVELVSSVRGYGHVKEKNYQQYKVLLKQQLRSYRKALSVGQ